MDLERGEQHVLLFQNGAWDLQTSTLRRIILNKDFGTDVVLNKIIDILDKKIECGNIVRVVFVTPVSVYFYYTYILIN
jgi:hypothetical protein